MPEGSEAKLARIDERTKALDEKIDAFIAALHEKEKDQDGKIDRLNDWKNYLSGAIAILGALLGLHAAQH